ncbi:tRNA preQ1(34) S-adenosylmethionine ribosyltransferase-isomerase QueA [Deinococcus maricopensis]|uniref:S-adenosylmethionine:tRNA ribosyltransferase-isomerase n=1 Tax=Deinococcus maricopensis (strain DSM 21211 / LMG 22137 / NRRL B-23946 / LB-34) TaxID=709986 RepID=E8U9H5_DEIML|nr:tRNA preQ1(34) S-adenosylmethionine ribosyltransferase-isomerase QueA [Deinococcus maricopensis]ADV67714.1 S-adenosylmethionine:tRNAribosyltransferase-isomerase [Deinococcus maricopensis DSM 21211]
MSDTPHPITEHANPGADEALARLNFDLPPERIAQTGAEPRDTSRLMVVGESGIDHRIFRDLPDLLRTGDLLVFNESRVIPARIIARKPTGGAVETLLLREEEANVWSAYLKGAKRAGRDLLFGSVHAEVIGTLEDGARLLRFSEDIKPHLDALGRLPLPPYIDAGEDDAVWQDRYQTVYARTAGSVAAPTAGLHFTPELLARLQAMGVGTAFVTLHVGAGTFKPISGSVAEHTMHAERYTVTSDTADAINAARREGRRVIAVGTTTVRALESAADVNGTVHPGDGDTRIFITPGHAWRVPDLLITNLHLPNSTLLLLVAAFAGEDRIRAAYQAALDHPYRFYSLGDAMLLQRAP